MVNLRDYYVSKEGWIHDKIPQVVQELQYIRFFNRFEKDTIYQMMKKADLRIVKQQHLLFLEEDQSAIVINGCLHLFSHTVDVQTPILQAIYNPGDIIGNSQIDKGWSRDTHSWILAYQECDILVINTQYVNYLWDKMNTN